MTCVSEMARPTTDFPARGEAAADSYASERGRDQGWLAKGDVPGLCGVFPKAAPSPI